MLISPILINPLINQSALGGGTAGHIQEQPAIGGEQFVVAGADGDGDPALVQAAHPIVKVVNIYESTTQGIVAFFIDAFAGLHTGHGVLTATPMGQCPFLVAGSAISPLVDARAVGSGGPNDFHGQAAVLIDGRVYAVGQLTRGDRG